MVLPSPLSRLLWLAVSLQYRGTGWLWIDIARLLYIYKLSFALLSSLDHL